MANGRETEQIAIDAYEAAGYEVYQPPHAKYREQDVFGLFDILAFGHGRLEAVQVKGGRDAAGIKQWFEDARPFEAHIGDLRLCFMHRPHEAWRVARSAENGYQWVYDARKATSKGATSIADALR